MGKCRWHHTRLLAALLALGIAGCSPAPLPSLSDPPNDYRQITANYLSTIPALPREGALISELREAKAPQPADWFACVKLKNGAYYVVFFINGNANQIRRPVGVDLCPETYQPLPAAKTSKPK